MRQKGRQYNLNGNIYTIRLYSIHRHTLVVRITVCGTAAPYNSHNWIIIEEKTNVKCSNVWWWWFVVYELWIEWTTSVSPFIRTHFTSIWFVVVCLLVTSKSVAVRMYTPKSKTFIVFSNVHRASCIVRKRINVDSRYIYMYKQFKLKVQIVCCRHYIRLSGCLDV